MAVFSKRRLRDLIATSITGSGWGVLYLSGDNDHPMRFLAYDENESYTVRVYIWNISHGGKTRDKDEFRIQVTGFDHLELEPGNNARTLLLGYWDNNGVFAGFDIRRHMDPLGASPSIQVGREALVDAYANGYGFHVRGNDEVAVAFRPDLLVDYIRDWKTLHDFGSATQYVAVVNQAIAATAGAGAQPNMAGVPAERQTAIKTVTEKVRDKGFRRRVLYAYDHTCAFCGVQLDLIDAAHILPVGHPRSTDETANGISLCPLHHRAFDKSLLTFDGNWQIHFNRREVHRLQGIGHHGGLDDFREALRDFIALPADANLRPRPDFLNLANRERGWRLP